MSRGRTTRRRVAVCSECFARVETTATGRPRATCSFACALRRQRRREREWLAEHVDESTEWWLSLSFEQRLAAVAHARANPAPKWWRGGVQFWAFCNRSAFSCEGRPVSLEGCSP